MTYQLIAYGMYAIITIALTVWVGHTLHKHGRQFVVDAFQGDETRGDAVNHLLLSGFYLLNFGFVALFLRWGEKPTDAVGAVEYIATKIGIVLVVLGAMHYFNLWNFDRLRRKGKDVGVKYVQF